MDLVLNYFNGKITNIDKKGNLNLKFKETIYEFIKIKFKN